MRKIEWTKEEEQKLIEIFNKYDWDDLISIFNRPKTAILKKTSKLGLKRDLRLQKYNRIWIEQETKYLIEHYATGNISDIAKILNRSKKAICERAKILKLKRQIIYRKHKINEDFFAEWSNDMAYVLGLICADGCLSSSQYSISIYLHKNDSYLLEKISKSMKSTYKVHFKKNMSTLTIHSKKMYNDLLELNLTSAKSLTLECPEIPQEFIPKFILGVLDGDGSIDVSRRRAKISTASDRFAQKLCLLLEKINIVHKIYNEPYVWRGNKRDFFNIRILRDNDLRRLYNAMYDNTTLFMKRKKKAFIEMGILEKDFGIRNKSIMRPLIATNIKTGKKIKFGSVKEAVESGFTRPHIYDVLHGRYTHHKGYTWKYATKGDTK